MALADDRTRDRVRQEALLAHQDRLAQLRGLAGELVAHADTDRLMQVAADRARTLARADAALIVRLDPCSGRAAGAWASGQPVDGPAAGVELGDHGMLARVAAGEVVQTPSAGADPDSAWPTNQVRIGPMLAVPVCDGEGVEAVLFVGRGVEGSPFDADDRVIAETVARMCAAGMRISRQFTELRALNAQLAEAAATDPLLGIGNRRAFVDAVRFQHATALRYGVPYGLLLGDLDHFKEYNDLYGHQAGDRALITVAGLLKAGIRNVDAVYRWGGEEIVVLLPHQLAGGTAAAGERLRRRVQEAGLEHGRNEGRPLTISFGGACFAPELPEARGLTWEDVLAIADRTLYRAKGHGRNCVEVAAAVPAVLEARSAADPTAGS